MRPWFVVLLSFAAVLTIPAVATLAPTIASADITTADGSYTTGAVVDITTTYDQAVRVDTAGDFGATGIDPPNADFTEAHT